MMVFAQPLWFAAFAVIPIIYWLHRWHMPESTITVSAIFLWDDSKDTPASGPARKRPDASWWRRALIAVLIVLVLAQPFWRTQQSSLTVWVDDSLSMLSVEDGVRRATTAMQQFEADLLDSGIDRAAVSWRSLGKPGVSFLPASTSKESLHWLLTDGSSDLVREWAASAFISHIIQTGQATENVAISKLSVSRSLTTGNSFDVLVSVSNTGLADDTRQIELFAGGSRAAQTELSLSAGETAYWRAQIPATASEVTASLRSVDVLVEDDMLAVQTASLQAIDTSVDEACGPALRLALARHPSLKILATGTDAQLTVTCHTGFFPNPPNAGGAAIRSLQSPGQSETTNLVWTASETFPQRLLLAGDYIKAVPAAEPLANNSNDILAQNGGQALVVGHAISPDSLRTIDTVIDLSDPTFTRQPGFPALVAVLVDLAHGRRVLDDSVTTSRDPESSIIIPLRMDVAADVRTAALNDVESPLSRLILVLAILVLLFDLALMIRAKRKIHRE